MGLALSFAALDWVMSLEPLWSSSLFGVYFFAGAFVAALAVLTLATVVAQGPNLFGSLVNPSHLASLGKLLLAFTAFWAYIAFSQYFLVWIAHLPREVGWYRVRTQGGWGALAVALVLAQFLLPFLLLLSRPLKRRRRWLGAVAAWVLLAHALDTWWLVLPVVEREGPRLHWADVAAFVGVGGASIAFALWRLRGHATLPLQDPYLHESLRYSK